MNILNIEYEKYKLDNGLEVILYCNQNLPITAVNLWYKVGSANEVEGKSGMAHLFEHMMFQGSQNVQKEMHFRFIQEAGGSLNGSTSFDRTNYYEKIPSNFLEMALWLESDRMGYLLPAITQEKLSNQIDVVKNERLERYDNQPYGLAWEFLITNLYPKGHPYSWPTIGFLDDISGFKLDDVKSFFKTYYAPGNASLVVAGNYKEKPAKELINKYFSEIPPHNHIPPIEIPEVKLDENIVLLHKEDVQLERLYLAWPSDKAYGKYDASLDILADILSGSKNSRLYKNLVYENELAQDVTAYQYSGKYAGHFMIVITAKPGESLEHLKEEVFKEFENIKTNGVTEKELMKSKNGVKSSFIFSMQNIESIADHLNFYNFFFNEPNYFSNDLVRYEAVTNGSIKNAIEQFLFKPYVELKILPSKL